MTEPLAGRCRRAGDVLRRHGTDLLVAGDPATVLWLTGRVAEIEFGPPSPIWAGTYVILDASGRGTTVCPEDEVGAGPAIDGLAVAGYEAYSLGPLQAYTNAAVLVAEAVRGAASVAVEADAVALSIGGAFGAANPGAPTPDGSPPRVAPPPRMVDVTGDMRALRMVKDADEIAAIERAAAVVSAGQRAFRAEARPGMREIELFSAIHAAMESEAGTRVPVLPDLMSGPRLLEVGRPPTDRRIEAGELALCDLAARGPLGYWADSCTTICVGRPTDEMQRLHDAVRRTLDRGIALARPGVVGGDLDAELRAMMAEAGYTWPHHAGHAVGAGYHEEPRIVPGSTVPLDENMVIALEPGGFGNGIGARVEHVVVVTPSGGRILTDYETRLEQ